MTDLPKMLASSLKSGASQSILSNSFKTAMNLKKQQNLKILINLMFHF